MATHIVKSHPMVPVAVVLHLKCIEFIIMIIMKIFLVSPPALGASHTARDVHVHSSGPDVEVFFEEMFILHFLCKESPVSRLCNRQRFLPWENLLIPFPSNMISCVLSSRMRKQRGW